MERSRLRIIKPSDLSAEILRLYRRPALGDGVISISDESVPIRGDALGKTWWRGRQWAVTDYGLERRNGQYAIEKSRLDESREGLRGGRIPDWLPHMAGKAWVDIDDFCTAFLVALSLHGLGRNFTQAGISEGLKQATAHRYPG